MWLILTLTFVGTAPEYEWRRFDVPNELVSWQVRSGYIDVAVAKDGRRFLLATGKGALFRGGDKLGGRWQKELPFRGLGGVGFLDKKRAIVSNGKELIQISLDKGEVIQRVPAGLSRFAVLDSGHLVGTIRRDHPPRFSHVIISPEDGKVVFDFGDDVLRSSTTVIDRSGTRFATGTSHESVWLGDAKSRTIRQVTRPRSENYFEALCFDASGRFLAAGVGDCEIAVFDLPKIPIDFRKSPRYLGKFDRPRRINYCTGIGFVQDKWLWFANTGDLYFYTWPELEQVLVTGPAAVEANFVVWKGSEDGRLLVGIDRLGKVYYARLKQPTP